MRRGTPLRVFQRNWYYERHHCQLVLVLDVVEGKRKNGRRIWIWCQTFALTFFPAIDLGWRRHGVEVDANETNGAAEELLAAEGASGGETCGSSVVQDVIAATQAQYMS